MILPVRMAGETEVGVQKITNVWAGLDRKRQVIVILSSIAMFAGVLLMSRIATQPRLQLLYSGLETGASGDVLRALDQRGITYEVRGGAIYVAARDRDRLRMTLASEGLPANGNQGYELLDSLSGFGTTSQMFDAAYWRAKEGELARTIVASRNFNQARVHIANADSNPFRRAVKPTASVWVTPAGSQVSLSQAKALRFLIASAVSGLSVDDVAIINANGTLIGGDDKPDSSASANARVDILRDRVQRLLEARVGKGNAIVEISVDTVTQTETIKERRLDPESRVVISTDSQESSDNSTNASSDVSVASNLPEGDAGSGQKSSAKTNDTRERVNYDVSETQREISRVPGDIKRLTVAVLVNGAPPESADAAAFVARPEEELSALRDLVASAVGFQKSRGDVITIKSMDLQAPRPLGTEAVSSLFDRLKVDAMAMAQMLILAIVTLLLGLLVVRPLLMKPAIAPLAVLPRPVGSNDKIPPRDTAIANALTGEIDDGAETFPPPARLEGGADNPVAIANGSQGDPVSRLRALIGERQEETVEILRSWLEEQKEGVQ